MCKRAKTAQMTRMTKTQQWCTRPCASRFLRLKWSLKNKSMTTAPRSRSSRARMLNSTTWSVIENYHCKRNWSWMKMKKKPPNATRKTQSRLCKGILVATLRSFRIRTRSEDQAFTVLRLTLHRWTHTCCKKPWKREKTTTSTIVSSSWTAMPVRIRIPFRRTKF